MLWNGNECGKTKVMRISMKIMIDRKQLENVEYFNYLDSMITNDARCTCEIKSRIAMEKQHSTRRRIFSPANWT
jgi:hypothetical protein